MVWQTHKESVAQLMESCNGFHFSIPSNHIHTLLRINTLLGIHNPSWSHIHMIHTLKEDAYKYYYVEHQFCMEKNALLTQTNLLAVIRTAATTTKECYKSTEATI